MWQYQSVRKCSTILVILLASKLLLYLRTDSCDLPEKLKCTPKQSKTISLLGKHPDKLKPVGIHVWNGARFRSSCREGWNGEPLMMLSICSHTILLGSEKPTLNAYPCQIVLAQCREIADTANAMNGSVGARCMRLGGCMSVSSGGTDFVSPSTSDAETRPRPTKFARLSRHAKFFAMLLLSPEKGF